MAGVFGETVTAPVMAAAVVITLGAGVIPDGGVTTDNSIPHANSIKSVKWVFMQKKEKIYLPHGQELQPHRRDVRRDLLGYCEMYLRLPEIEAFGVTVYLMRFRLPVVATPAAPVAPARFLARPFALLLPRIATHT